MQIDRLATMILNRVLRQVINKGVSKGIDHMAGGGKSRAEMSPEDRASAQSTRGAMQKARRGWSLFRRLR
ncbi:hypothetical protein [Poseidonocella sedimentorum]|uniref:Uncharacterized protein n=1 Tax=Poseidonocella sedimentorum TaxID=871652 RepID=A0A1I6DG21_9RHOB|nr:hypothetical protein [Poseidonocella sedimentorum]SFR04328.1 hypothetical protein SAMN04515673_103156 [Poseidonocella sedimentorum]